MIRRSLLTGSFFDFKGLPALSQSVCIMKQEDSQ